MTTSNRHQIWAANEEQVLKRGNDGADAEAEFRDDRIVLMIVGKARRFQSDCPAPAARAFSCVVRWSLGSVAVAELAGSVQLLAQNALSRGFGYRLRGI